MDMLSIETSHHVEDIKSLLVSEFRPLLDDGVQVQWDEISHGCYTALNCTMVDKSNALAANPIDICKYYAANALSEYIMDAFEERIVDQTVRRDYKELSPEDQSFVREASIRRLREDDRSLRKTRILYSLLDYFDLSDFINLEGFVRFRLRNYGEIVKRAVEESASQLKLEREYREFVRLLKYFVDMHEPKIPTAHVVLRSNGLFRLVDDDNNVIENEYLEGFVTDLVNTKLDYEDLLLSALITTAPQKIIVHLSSKWSVTQTLVNVFEDRVVICTSNCEYCQKSNKYMERLELH